MSLLIVTQFTTSACLQPDYEIFSYNDRRKRKEKIIKHLYDHGFIAFRGIPKYKEAYQEYLKVAQDFIKLPDSEKAKCSPTNNNELGWSYGIEKFNGQIDCQKGSYYAHIPERE